MQEKKKKNLVEKKKELAIFLSTFSNFYIFFCKFSFSLLSTDSIILD